MDESTAGRGRCTAVDYTSWFIRLKAMTSFTKKLAKRTDQTEAVESVANVDAFFSREEVCQDEETSANTRVQRLSF
jgi:hypothetical protein